MKKIRTYKDIAHQLELVEMQREVNMDKLKDGIQKTKSNIVPSLFTLSLKTLFKRKKKKK